MTPLARAARALHRSRMERQHPEPDSYPWESLSAHDQQLMMLEVKVLLRAIRDPSLAMTGDGAAEIHAEHTNGGIHANAVWQAMIDAALVEPNPSAHQS